MLWSAFMKTGLRVSQVEPFLLQRSLCNQNWWRECFLLAVIKQRPIGSVQTTANKKRSRHQFWLLRVAFCNIIGCLVVMDLKSFNTKFKLFRLSLKWMRYLVANGLFRGWVNWNCLALVLVTGMLAIGYPKKKVTASNLFTTKVTAVTLEKVKDFYLRKKITAAVTWEKRLVQLLSAWETLLR